MEFTAERDEDLPDGMMAETATAELQTLHQSGQPFFLGLGFLNLIFPL